MLESKSLERELTFVLFKTTKARKWPSAENQKFFVVQATRSENLNIFLEICLLL